MIGNAYQPTFCNGHDYNPNCAGQAVDLPLASGAAFGCPPPPQTQCVTPEGVADLSGNVFDLTGDDRGQTTRGGGFSWDSYAAQLQPRSVVEATYRSNTCGARICASVRVHR